jgi:hypothetical protein
MEELDYNLARLSSHTFSDAKQLVEALSVQLA